MRESFVKYFERCYPGMGLDGPTAKGEWAVWQIAFMRGRIFEIDIQRTALKEQGLPSAADLDVVAEENRIREVTEGV